MYIDEQWDSIVPIISRNKNIKIMVTLCCLEIFYCSIAVHICYFQLTCVIFIIIMNFIIFCWMFFLNFCCIFHSFCMMCICHFLLNVFTYWLNCLLNYLIIYLLTYLLTNSLTHSLGPMHVQSHCAVKFEISSYWVVEFELSECLYISHCSRCGLFTLRVIRDSVKWSYRSWWVHHTSRPSSRV